MRRVKLTALITFLLGLALFIALLVHQGAADVAKAVASAGWGLVWVTLFHAAPFLADTRCWWRLQNFHNRLPFRTLIWIRWIGEGVNSLLPVARIGGEVVRARLATSMGAPGVEAGATVVVDVTLAVLTQILFILLGLALLIWRLDDGAVAGIAMLGVTLLALALGLFYMIQRRGLFAVLAGGLRRVIGSDRWPALSDHAEALDSAILELYNDRKRLFAASAWRFTGWLLGAGEVWLAMRFLGHPVSLADAILLESLGVAVRAASFIVPGSIGVQEGGFLLIGGLVGLSPELALALSLVKRVRELGLGAVAILAWQITEGRLAWRARLSRGKTAGAEIPDQQTSS